ncbi:MAG: ABC transporter ATP-binding protein, partial [Selenomonadaceae bacterium]|nr:ABC transporter ATP-binding protein [Selenomonadaceae bacterium]
AEILILDEPTSGLDKKTSQKLIDSILNDCIKKDRTLIIITHDLFIAKLMDKIYKLYDNKIIYAN